MAGVADFQAWGAHMRNDAYRLGILEFLSVSDALILSHTAPPNFANLEKLYQYGVAKLPYPLQLEDVRSFLHVAEELDIYLGRPVTRSHDNPFAPAPQANPLPVPAPIAKSTTITKVGQIISLTFDGQVWVQEAKKSLDETPEYAKPNPDICPCGIHYRQCRYHDDRNYAAAKGR